MRIVIASLFAAVGTVAAAQEFRANGKPDIDHRPYLMGNTTQLSNLKQGIEGDEHFIEKMAPMMELAVVFSHIQWNNLTGKSVLEGHARALRQAELARENGLNIGLVHDFTHTHPEAMDEEWMGTGRLNLPPGGHTLPEEGLDDPALRKAYADEFVALVEQMKPKWAFAGIEINAFYKALPEQWPAYVEMYKDCYKRVKAISPGTKMGAYTVDTPDAQMTEALKMLLPELDVIGYSIYAEDPSKHSKEELTAILDIKPGIPLFIPEFGVRGGVGEQTVEKQVAGLEYLLETWAHVNTEGVAWLSFYDQDYTGAPQWFRDAFEPVGLYTREDKPKPAVELWKKFKALPHRPLKLEE